MRDRPVSAPAIAPAIAPVTVPVTVPVTTMVRHDAMDAAALRARLRDGGLTLAGNRRLKIYGRLDCPAGRRMKRGSRVFFTNRTAAELQLHRLRDEGWIDAGTRLVLIYLTVWTPNVDQISASPLSQPALVAGPPRQPSAPSVAACGGAWSASVESSRAEAAL